VAASAAGGGASGACRASGYCAGVVVADAASSLTLYLWAR
jgi:hypothetical protein